MRSVVLEIGMLVSQWEGQEMINALVERSFEAFQQKPY